MIQSRKRDGKVITKEGLRELMLKLGGGLLERKESLMISDKLNMLIFIKKSLISKRGK